MPAKTIGCACQSKLMSLVTGTLIALSALRSPCQTPVPTAANASAANASSEQMPAYEVATITPPAPNGFAIPLRMYIQEAFGIPPNSTGWVIGPDWINSARYVIQGKPPDAIRDAMRTMPPQERTKEIRLMQQNLLADRFRLKTHFEAREMPVYQLIVAKGGSKLKENPDAGKGQAAVGGSMIRGRGVPIHVLSDLLESVQDIGGRVVVDRTGLSGNYDFQLRWTPVEAAAPSSGSGGAAPMSDAEGVSLFTAIEEQLGLKLVSAREQGQVLVIDHIERPSEN